MATLLEWPDPSGNTIAVELDLTSAEAWELAAEVTDHPVEEGAAVSDHIRPGLDTLTLEGWVALAPLVVPRVDPSGLTGSVRATTVRAGGVDHTFTVMQWDRAVDRRRVMDELFRALTAAGTLVSVTTSLRSVADLAVTRYRVDRSKDTSGVLAVTLDLRRVRKVATSRVTVTSPAQRRGQRAGQRGAQPARATDRRSTLARALDSARSLLP